LRRLLLAKTGGSIDFFLSSDGQSIPFGRNWVHEIERALDKCKIMFIFLTPTSIHSKWIYFEAGYAYSKGIDVVPIGCFGMDLNQISPPLGLLQGFNVKNSGGLNNILVKINESLGHNHEESFVENEYKAVRELADVPDSNLSIVYDLIHDITAQIEIEEGTSIADVATLLSNDGNDFVLDAESESIYGFGMRVQRRRSSKPGEGSTVSYRLQVSLGFRMLAKNLPKVLELTDKIGLLGGETELHISFELPMFIDNDGHKITDRLGSSEVRLDDRNRLQFRGTTFEVGTGFHFLAQGSTRGLSHVKVKGDSNSLTAAGIHDLLLILVERNVVYEKN